MALAPNLSLRASAVTKPRQLALEGGPALGGVEFSKGARLGGEGYVVGEMTKSRRGKLYIDDSGWGPEADSIEYGFRVPFGGIHVFIGKIGGSELGLDICTDLVEPARRKQPAKSMQPARVNPGRKHVFIGFTQGMELEGSVSAEETHVYSDEGSSCGETESIYQLQDERLGGYDGPYAEPEPYESEDEPPNHAAVFMAGSAAAQGGTPAMATQPGSGTPPA